MLAYIAMHPEHRATREQLADLLWGNRFDAQARHSLRQCLVSVRRDLEPVGAEILTFDGEMVGLNACHFTADAVAFATLAESAEATDRNHAIELYRGEFLVGLCLNAEGFDAWARAECSRLAGLAARLFADAATRCDAIGDGAGAIAAAERLVKLDELREDSQRLLLRVYARHRGRDAALAHANAVTKLLRAELDADPDPETRALIDDVKGGAITRAAVPSRTAQFAAEPASIAAPAQTEIAASTQALPIGQGGGVEDGIDPAHAPVSLPRTEWWRAMVAPRAMATHASLVLAVLSGIAAILWRAPDRSREMLFAGDPAAFRAERKPDASWQSPSIFRGRAADAQTLASLGLYGIAVLPFSAEAGNGSAEQKLADRLTDDLINDLSRIPTVRVIARQTTRLYHEKAVDVAAVGAELGVHYLVEGSVRMQDAKMRINVALIDAKSRLHVWSDRFERAEADRFAVQDEIARGLARRLQISMIFDRSNRPGSSDPGLDELLARGWAIIFRYSIAGNVKGADELFEQALKRDPDNASAMIGLAAYHISLVTSHDVVDREPSLAAAEDLLTRVIRKRPQVSTAHYFHGLLLRVRGELQPALKAFAQSLELNPSLAAAHAQVGHILSRLGRSEEAFEQIRYAIRLSPKDPQLGMWSAFAAVAKLNLNREAAALEWLGRAAVLSPRMPYVQAALASAHALKGDLAAARKHVAELKRLAPLHSEASLLKSYIGPDGEQVHATRFTEGLRVALKASS